jgi:hypothetical protein
MVTDDMPDYQEFVTAVQNLGNGLIEISQLDIPEPDLEKMRDDPSISLPEDVYQTSEFTHTWNQVLNSALHVEVGA